MEFRPLNEAPEYINECALILNEEWKRSLTARLHSLEKSRPDFPICLVLLEKDGTKNYTVVGHSRVSNVQGQANKSCLVESVVVTKSHRGKGYGKILMHKTEEFAASKGYKTMYLTTHDKQDFYRHIGYDFCSAVVSLGSNILPDHLAQKLMVSLNLQTSKCSTNNNTNCDRTNSNTTNSCVNYTKSTNSDNTCKPQSKDAVLTKLPNPAIPVTTPAVPTRRSTPQTLPPAPGIRPPAPPPPPGLPAPPAPSITEATQASENKTVTRWDPSKVSWMKKSIS